VGTGNQIWPERTILEDHPWNKIHEIQEDDSEMRSLTLYKGGASPSEVVQVFSVFSLLFVTNSNKISRFSFFYRSGNVGGHVSETLAPLHHQMSIYYLFKENQRKSKENAWCKLSASVVQHGARLVQVKILIWGLHHDFFIKNQMVIKGGAVVQLEKYSIDCQSERDLHHRGYFRSGISKIRNICRKPGFSLVLTVVCDCRGVQSFLSWSSVHLCEKYLLKGFLISVKIVRRLLSLLDFSSISVVGLCRGGKHNLDIKPKKAKSPELHKVLKSAVTGINQILKGNKINGFVISGFKKSAIRCGM